MKRVVLSIFAVAVIGLIASCTTTNPGVEPSVEIKWAKELFALNPDKIDEPVLVANFNIKHPAPIAEWTIQVNRGQAGAQAAAQAAAQNLATGNTQAAAANARENANRAPFYEESGKGKPGAWKWDGKSNRKARDGSIRNDRVQSATDYQVSLTITDTFGNTKTIEDTLSVDVLTMKDKDGNLRILVSNIVFPPNGSDLTKVSESDQRANRRVLRLIGNVLKNKKFASYAVTVEGHANPTTPPDTPQRTAEENGTATVIGLVPLSKARAQAVADYLVGDGDITADRLTVVGIGGERTVAAWDDPDENDKNRRVEFILKK